MEIQENEVVVVKEKVIITDEQRKQIYGLASRISKDTIEEVCPALYRICLNSEKGALKNQLGNVIFHLAKNERLNTRIGLEKLIDASLIVAPDAMYKILEDSEQDAKELAQKIKKILK